MSSLPPDLPPPPPPPPSWPTGGPPPPAGPAAGLPWEMRPQVGFADALVDTVRLFATSPREAWSRTREKGDYGQPLFFAICVGWVGAAFNIVWSMMFGQVWLRFVPPDVRDMVTGFAARTVGWTVVQIFVAPLGVLIGLFVGAAILHVCLAIVGGLSGSGAGFEGTVRVVGYSWVAQLAHIVPIFGGLIAMVWTLVLWVLGIERLHRTTQGRAVLAVVIPIALCCGCILIALLLGGAALLHAFGRMR